MEISKTYKFEAAHRLPFVPEGHPCGRVHGHSYVVVLTVQGNVLRDMGWVTDFAQITQEWKPLEAQLDHHSLNDILDNPTAELLCWWIFSKLAVSPLLRLSRVEVRETASSAAVLDSSEWDPWAYEKLVKPVTDRLGVL